MNFKKIVSAASALTIAASAFASMGIVANATVGTGTAEDPYYNYDFNSWEIGTIVNSGSTTSTTTATSTDGELSFAVGSTNRNGGNISIEGNDSNKNMQFIAGQFSEDGRKPTITFNNIPLFEQIGDTNNLIIEYDFANRSNNPVLVYAYNDTTKPLATVDVVADLGISAAQNPAWYHAKMVINYTDSTYSFTATDSAGAVTGTKAGNFETASLAGFQKFGVTGGKSAAYLYLDNLKIYSEAKPVVAAGSVTVKYMNGSEAITGVTVPTVDVTDKSAGDIVTYNTKAYIQDGSGQWYKAVETDSYQKSVALTENTQVSEVAYTPVNVTYYAEGESFTGQFSHGADFASGGLYKRQLGNKGTTSYTVEETGYYSITLAGIVSTNSTKNTVNASVDGSIVASVSGLSTTKVTENTTTNVLLRKGDVVEIIGLGWEAGLDYMVFTKTGDYVPTTINMTNAGVSNGINHDSVATSFYADLTSCTGTLKSVDVTSGENTMPITVGTTLTDANVVFGLIVNGLNDGAATAVITLD